MKQIVLASRNQGKLRELAALLSDVPVEILSLESLPDIPDVDEDGDTFLKNAEIKARTVSRLTGLPALADDSGLEVDALDGDPGIRSARFGGVGLTDAGRCSRLLERMDTIQCADRGAQFRCVMVFDDTRSVQWREGICRGSVIHERRGSNGFGYDPIFVPDGYFETFAELDPAVKNRISHRAKALGQIRDVLMESVSH